MQVDLFGEKVDEFRAMGIETNDKMMFYLLKWMFNAIKIDSDPNDTKLQGKAYILKNDLIK